MKKSILTLGFLLLTIAYCYSQNQVNSYKADLEFLKINLPEKHVNLFAKMSRSEFEKQIDSIESKIGILNEESFLNELLQLMVAIGDEHTRVFPSNFLNYTLPINFTVFNEGIFVTEVEQSDLLLAKLTEINGVPINEIAQKLKSIIPSYNQSFFKTMLLFYINNSYILKGMGIINSSETVPYTLEKTDGNITSITLKPNRNVKMLKPKQFSSLQAYSRAGNYWYQYNAERDLIYFNYSNCKEDTDYPFDKFNKELFESISANKPKILILDLRYNGGGNSAILDPFLAELKKSDFNHLGKLYVLIGKMTFSSALLNAIDLKRNYNTILVGEPTAGSINHYGEVRSFELPNTKATVVYSTNYFEEWKGHDGALNPDILINYSIENFIKGLDEAFEAAVKNRTSTSL